MAGIDLRHTALIALLLVSPGMPAQEEAPTEADLKAIEEAIARTEQHIDETSAERNALSREIEATEKRIASLSQDIDATRDALADERDAQQDLKERQARLETLIDEQRELVADYLRSAWQTGRTEYLKLLLNQEDIARSARILRYYEYLSEARAERIADFNANLDELESVNAELEASMQRLTTRREELETQQQALQEAQSERQDMLAQLEQDLAESDQELTRLQQERDEMERLIEELNRSLTDLPIGNQEQPFGQLKGQLPWPVAGPLRNSFGSSQGQGDLTWQGVNIAAEAGAEVRAIHHGRVVYADWFRSAGLLLIIDHGDGYMSLYAQNQQLYHSVGDWVDAGETIATVGSTGGRPETGLYFEIRHNGRSRDPVAWCMSRD